MWAHLLSCGRVNCRWIYKRAYSRMASPGILSVSLHHVCISCLPVQLLPDDIQFPQLDYKGKWSQSTPTPTSSLTQNTCWVNSCQRNEYNPILLSFALASMADDRFFFFSNDSFVVSTGGARGKEPTCQWRRRKNRGFDPWVRKISWRRTGQPTSIFLLGESHGQRSLEGYSP